MVATGTKQESGMTPESRVEILERFSKEQGVHWSIPDVASQDFRVTKSDDRYTISCMTVDGSTSTSISRREVASFSLDGQFLSGSSAEKSESSSNSQDLSPRQADEMLNRIVEIRSPKMVGSLAKDPFEKMMFPPV